MVTSANEWRGRKGTELNLPSGNTALVRAPGIQHFLKAGRLPNSLRTMIMRGIKGDEKVKLEALFEDESNFIELFELIDQVLLQVVIEPEVKPVPLDDEGVEVPLGSRDQGFIYVDEVDMEDKFFIFQFAVGGTRDLERFREEQATGLANLQSSESLASSSE
jgi:hypothetical protein